MGANVLMAFDSRHEIRDLVTLVPWRRSRLRHAGFDAELVARIADDPRYDLLGLLELVDRGCPPALAARILAPIEGETP